jgi:hypothetical protein
MENHSPWEEIIPPVNETAGNSKEAELDLLSSDED